jgi:hypothetical protein
MIAYNLVLESATPLLYNRAYDTFVAKESRETSDAYEQRTWLNRAQVNENGYVTIPGIYFSNAIQEAAKYLGEQIPGKGKSTYTKHFAAGISVVNGIVTEVKPEALDRLPMHVPVDGIHGSGKRAWKFFPRLNSWKGTIQVAVLDEIITKDVLHKHAVTAGNFIGVGSRRPINRGEFGRFRVVDIAKV